MRVLELILAVCVSVCVLQVSHGGGHDSELHFDCREGWKLYEGVCYKAYNIPMTWDEASETCYRQGGELFDPAIQEVFLYLKEELPGTFWTRFKVTEENEERLQNINRWADYEPKADGGSCVSMNQMKGYWRQDCDKLNNVVCEYDACLSGYVPCALGSKCVNKTSSICNAVWDCEDRSDERNCGSACNTYTLIPADTTSSGFSTNTINDWKDCWWTFEAEVGKLIRLFVPGMNLEISVAHLHILTGSPDVKYSRTVEYETGSIGEHYLYSDNNFLHVRMYAGDLAAPITSQTFTWTTVSDMRAQENVLQASDVYQTLKFPLSSEAFRPQGMTVYWTITAPEGEIISYHIECMLSAGVTSTPISVIGGSDDGVYLRNTNTFYATSTNMLKVRMEYSASIDSFTLYYITGCDITITRWAGVIESPGKLEDTIPHELSCEWTLNAGQTRNPPRGMMVEIEKDLAEDPRKAAVDNLIMDTLEVFADDDTNALTADVDGYYAAPGGKLSIKFDSDETVHSKYFLASFGVDCEALSLSAETTKSNENAFYGKDVTLSCPVGNQFNLEKYKTESSVTAKCTLDGFVLEDGTNVIPECQDVRCGTPPKINNGYIIKATSTSYKGNAWYGCHPGFSIEGSSMVTCTHQGSWETPPRCISSQCSDAGGVLDVTDGGYEIEAGNPLDGGSADFGVILRFYCDPGFELIGQQRTHCTGNGWTHTDPPTCRRRKCIVPTVTNAETLNTLTVDFESTVEITCKSGYTPSATQVLTCLEDQTFDKEVTCTNECQTDPCDADLQTCTDTDPGYICTCIDGYETDGNNGCKDVRECSVDNGGCSDRCIELPGSYECLCESEGSVLFTEDGLHGHTIPASETGLLPGDLYRYNHTCVNECQTDPCDADLQTCTDTDPGYICTCIDGYETDGNNGCKDVRECSVDNGGCSDRCIELPGSYECLCESEGSVLFTEDGLHGHTIPASETGLLPGDLYRYNHTCVNECQTDPCDADLQTCTDTDPGYICTCIDGYETDGNNGCKDVRECSVDNGGCSDRCIELPGSYECLCESEGSVLFTEDGLHGHTIPASETGLLPGDLYRYNHTCVKTSCPPLEEVTNGVFSSNDRTLFYGDTITLRCEDGYETSGGFDEVELECTSSIGTDTCTARSCTIPPAPQFGTFDKTSVWFKETINLNCDYSDTRNITRTASCIYDNGAMRLGGENIASCPVIDCGTPVLPVGGEYRNWAARSSTLFLENASFEFTCGVGYDISGASGDSTSSEVKCKSNGRWDFGTLRCDGKRCSDPGTPVDARQIVDTYERGQTLSYECVRDGFAPRLDGEERTYECVYDAATDTVDWSDNLGPGNLPTCTDVTDPVINVCPGNKFYFPMDKVQVDQTVFSDNFGLNVEGRNNYMATGDVILNDEQFTYSASDFEDGETTCSFTFSILDRDAKPALTCPDVETVRVMSSDDGSMDVIDFVTIDNSEGLQLSPSSIQKTVNNIGTSQIARVNVIDVYGRRAECTFMIHFEAGKCFQESLYPDGNAVRSCVETANGLSCNSTCNANYVFNDGTKMKTFGCSNPNQDWNFPEDLDIFCLPIENPAYLADITIEYEFDGLATLCLDPFNEQINNHLTNFETNIRTQIPACNGMELQVTVRTPGTNPSLFAFQAELQINLQNEAFTSEQKDQCVTDLLADAESVFKVNENRLVCNGELDLNVVYKSASPPQLSCVTSSYHLKNTPDGEQVCVPCGPGYSFDEGSNVCTRCSADQYQNLTNQVECETCPSASAPDPLQIDCDSTCPAGFTSTDGFYPCRPCPVDQYWVDSKTCSPCPDGKSTTGLKGAKREDECYAQCPVGTYSETGYNVEGCTSCPLGFYQPDVGQQVCLECPTNTTTAAIQTINSNDCIPMDACDSFGCDAEGTQACEHIFHRAVCKCKDGFRGEKCNQKNEICDYNPCTGGSTCEPVAGGSNRDFTCSCRTDLDVCNVNVNTSNVEMESATAYATYSLNQEDCQDNCTNDVQCVSAMHFVVGTSGFCLLFDSTINTKPLESGDSSVYMVKECVTAFSGDRCEKDTFPDCDSADCASGSMCMDKVNGFECLCPTEGGFSGPKCAQAVDVCSPNPCENGGACTAHGTVRFECTCADGYTGETCGTLIYQCAMNPGVCLYYGSCVPLVNDYTCFCVPGFDGSYCQNVPDFCTVNSDCLGNPCISNTDEKEGYCFCNGPLFERSSSDDSVCIKVKEPCDLFTCENEGTCVNSEDGLTASCSCPPEFTGHKCQHNVDDCTEMACENGGTCNDMVGEFDCTCAPGYYGETCERDLDYCAGESCGNGVCVDGVTTFTCDCSPGYTGTACETYINECLSFPCQHDGTCEPGLDSYTCTCSRGWTGNNCESAVDKCSGADNKCENDGKCFTILESSICRCEGGTLGEFCQNATDICDMMSDADLCQNNGACQNKEGTAVCICDIEYSVDRCYFRAGVEDTSGGNEYYSNSNPFTSADDCKEQCLQQRECAGVTHVGTFCLFYTLLDIAMQFEEGAVHYSRVCPTDYSGDSCECIKDWCADETICQNGGTCSPVSPKGFKCHCQDGYSGVVCEVAADPCASSPCGTSGATCTSSVTDYVCQCPQGNVFNGTACKAPESNFNLLVDNLNNGAKTPPMLAAPFRLDSRALSVMMWVRVFDFKDKAVLLQLFRSTHLDISNRYFSLTLSQSSPGDDGGIQTEIGETIQYLPHETNVNDGEWHHIGVAIDEDGQLSSTIDARTNSAYLNIGQGLQSNDNGWLQLGESVIAEYRDITVWNTYLTSEDFSLAFNDQMLSGAPVQGWWNYVLQSSTTLLRSDRATSPILDSAMMPPVLNCVEVVSPVSHVLADRFVSLDNIVDFKQNLDEINKNNPGLKIQHNLPAELPWGWKAGIVVGMNENGYDQCRFPVYVKYNDQCPAPIKLSDDAQYSTCNSGDGICSVSCSNNNEGLAGRLPRYVPCSGVGVYNVEAPYDDFILPACNPKASIKYVITAKMQFEFVIECATFTESLPTEVKEVILDSFANLNTNKLTDICSLNCSNIEITTAQCSSDSSTPKRFVLEFEIQLDNDYLTYAGGGDVPAEDAIWIIVKLDEDLSLKRFGSGELLPDTVEIMSSEKCITSGSIMIFETNPVDPSNPNKMCVPCGPGSFYRWEAGMESDCVACPKGYYQDELGQMMCKDCGNGGNGNPRTTYQMGATSETQCVVYCDIGEELIEGKCMPCNRGYFKDNRNDQSRFGMCEQCPDTEFTTDELGSTSSDKCYVPVCNAGEYVDGNECKLCAENSYQTTEVPISTITCTPCEPIGNVPTGTRLEGSASLSDCLAICDGGKQFDSESNLCTDCPRGTYKEASNKFDSCHLCPPSHTTAGTGATSPSYCNIRNCQPGTFINASDECEPCPIGQYQDQPRKTACIPCGDELSTTGTGSDSSDLCQIFCNPGNQGISMDGAPKSCIKCPEHFYKSKAGLDPCVECPANYTSNDERTACPDLYCYYGYQYVRAGVGVAETCEMCAQGFYKDTKGNDVQCTECAPGWTTDGTGQRECSVRHCVAGSYFNVDIDDCSLCGIGTYKPDAGNMMCTACDSDKTTTGTGSTLATQCDISICPVGQYRDPQDKDCTVCPLNKYQDQIGQTACTDCGNGKITLTTESTSSTDCVPECQRGEQYVPESKSCTPCPDGTYKDAVGNALDACQVCPSDRTTVGTGSTSASDCSQRVCSIGTYGDVTSGTIVCKPCTIGSYSSQMGQNACTQCAGTTTLSVASDSVADCVEMCTVGNGYREIPGRCEPCVRGQYNDLSGNEPNKCKTCPHGKTNLRSGSSNCPNDDPTSTLTTGSIDVLTVLTYQVSIDNCNTDFNVILFGIANTVRGLFYSVQQNQFPRSTICSGPNCSNIEFSIVSNSCRALKRRRRRRREVNHELEVEVTFGNVSKNLVDSTNRQYPFEDILNRILTTDTKELSPSESSIVFDTFQTPVTTPVCFAGQRVVNSVCEKCPPGTYGVDGHCIECAADTYQNWNGSPSCKDCPENTFIDGLGSASIDACQSFCVAQPLHCNNHGTCYVTGRRSARCECFEDYEGDTCESKNEPSANMPVILGAAIGGALLIIVLIVVGVVCRYLSNKKKNRRKNEYSVDNDGVVSPVHDENPYDYISITSGSTRSHPYAPYRSSGHRTQGYRPDASFEQTRYQNVFTGRPNSHYENSFL